MPRFLAARRLAEISRRVSASGAVTVAELAGNFGVSRETIRRDLKRLADQGDLRVVHGGAVCCNERDDLAITRSETSGGGLDAIAQAVADLVKDGSTVLLDSGGVSGAVALGLSRRQRLIVCTNSLAHASQLARHPSIRVYLLGGQVDPMEDGAFGVDTLRALDGYHCDVAFVSAAGFAANGEMTDQTRQSAELRGRMLSAASQAFVVADYQAFCRAAPIRVGHFERASAILTDRAPGEPLASAFQRRSIRVIVAGT